MEPPINIDVQSITALKVLRQFTLDTFGVTSGLRITKDFMEALRKQKQEDDVREAFRKLVISLREANYSESDIKGWINAIYNAERKED